MSSTISTTYFTGSTFALLTHSTASLHHYLPSPLTFAAPILSNISASGVYTIDISNNHTTSKNSFSSTHIKSDGKLKNFSTPSSSNLSNSATVLPESNERNISLDSSTKVVVHNSLNEVEIEKKGIVSSMNRLVMQLNFTLLVRRLTANHKELLSKPETFFMRERIANTLDEIFNELMSVYLDSLSNRTDYSIDPTDMIIMKNISDSIRNLPENMQLKYSNLIKPIHYVLIYKNILHNTKVLQHKIRNIAQNSNSTSLTVTYKKYTSLISKFSRTSGFITTVRFNTPNPTRSELPSISENIYALNREYELVNSYSNEILDFMCGLRNAPSKFLMNVDGAHRMLHKLKSVSFFSRRFWLPGIIKVKLKEMRDPDFYLSLLESLTVYAVTDASKIVKLLDKKSNDTAEVEFGYSCKSIHIRKMLTK